MAAVVRDDELRPGMVVSPEEVEDPEPTVRPGMVVSADEVEDPPLSSYGPLELIPLSAPEPTVRPDMPPAPSSAEVQGQEMAVRPGMVVSADEVEDPPLSSYGPLELIPLSAPEPTVRPDMPPAPSSAEVQGQEMAVRPGMVVSADEVEDPPLSSYGPLELIPLSAVDDDPADEEPPGPVGQQAISGEATPEDKSTSLAGDFYWGFRSAATGLGGSFKSASALSAFKAGQRAEDAIARLDQALAMSDEVLREYDPLSRIPEPEPPRIWGQPASDLRTVSYEQPGRQASFALQRARILGDLSEARDNLRGWKKIEEERLQRAQELFVLAGQQAENARTSSFGQVNWADPKEAARDLGQLAAFGVGAAAPSMAAQMGGAYAGGVAGAAVGGVAGAVVPPVAPVAAATGKWVGSYTGSFLVARELTRGSLYAEYLQNGIEKEEAARLAELRSLPIAVVGSGVPGSFAGMGLRRFARPIGGAITRATGRKIATEGGKEVAKQTQRFMSKNAAQYFARYGLATPQARKMLARGLARDLVGIPIGAAGEGLEEATEEIMTIHALRDAGIEISPEEAWLRIADAAGIGVVAGAGMGAGLPAMRVSGALWGGAGTESPDIHLMTQQEAVEAATQYVNEFAGRDQNLELEVDPAHAAELADLVPKFMGDGVSPQEYKRLVVLAEAFPDHYNWLCEQEEQARRKSATEETQTFEAEAAEEETEARKPEQEPAEGEAAPIEEPPEFEPIPEDAAPPEVPPAAEEPAEVVPDEGEAQAAPPETPLIPKGPTAKSMAPDGQPVPMPVEEQEVLSSEVPHVAQARESAAQEAEQNAKVSIPGSKEEQAFRDEAEELRRPVPVTGDEIDEHNRRAVYTAPESALDADKRTPTVDGVPEGDAFPAGAPIVDPETLTPVWISPEDVTRQDRIPSFKRDADEVTGLTREMEGEFDVRGTAPVLIYEWADGTQEIASGRHRHELALKTNAARKAQGLPPIMILAQVLRESDGYTPADMIRLDAEQNIREGQGSVEDHALYFKNLPEGQTPEPGLLNSAKARAGYALGRTASDSLYQNWSDGNIPENHAVAIAIASEGDEAAQAVGMRAYFRGKQNRDTPSPDELRNIVLSYLMHPDARVLTDQEQIEMFEGYTEQRGKLASRLKQRDKDLAAALRSALRLSGKGQKQRVANQLKALNVSINIDDPVAVQQALDSVRERIYMWEDWRQFPALVAEVDAAAETEGAQTSTEIQQFLDFSVQQEELARANDRKARHAEQGMLDSPPPQAIKPRTPTPALAEPAPAEVIEEGQEDLFGPAEPAVAEPAPVAEPAVAEPAPVEAEVPKDVVLLGLEREMADVWETRDRLFGRIDAIRKAIRGNDNVPRRGDHQDALLRIYANIEDIITGLYQIEGWKPEHQNEGIQHLQRRMRAYESEIDTIARAVASHVSIGEAKPRRATKQVANLPALPPLVDSIDISKSGRVTVYTLPYEADKKNTRPSIGRIIGAEGARVDARERGRVLHETENRPASKFDAGKPLRLVIDAEPGDILAVSMKRVPGRASDQMYIRVRRDGEYTIHPTLKDAWESSTSLPDRTFERFRSLPDTLAQQEAASVQTPAAAPAAPAPGVEPTAEPTPATAEPAPAEDLFGPAEPAAAEPAAEQTPEAEPRPEAEPTPARAEGAPEPAAEPTPVQESQQEASARKAWEEAESRLQQLLSDADASQKEISRARGVAALKAAQYNQAKKRAQSRAEESVVDEWRRAQASGDVTARREAAARLLERVKARRMSAADRAQEAYNDALDRNADQAELDALEEAWTRAVEEEAASEGAPEDIRADPDSEEDTPAALSYPDQEEVVRNPDPEREKAYRNELMAMPVTELRAIAADLGIAKRSKMRKEQLVDAIIAMRSSDDMGEMVANISPKDIARAGAFIGRVVKGAASTIWALAVADMVDRISARTSKLSEAKQAFYERVKDGARGTVNDAKVFAGQLRNPLYNVLRRVNKMNRDMGHLMELVETEPGIYQSRFRMAVENRYDAHRFGALSAREQATINAMHALMDKAGAILESVNLLQKNPATGRWSRYTKGRRNLTRMFTHELISGLYAWGQNQEFIAALADALATLNTDHLVSSYVTRFSSRNTKDIARNRYLADPKLPTLFVKARATLGPKGNPNALTQAERQYISRQMAMAILWDMHQDTIAYGKQGETGTRQVAMESARMLPVWPEAISHKVMGVDTKVRIQETNPFVIAQRLADTTASRAAFIKTFGQFKSHDETWRHWKPILEHEAQQKWVLAPIKLPNTLRAQFEQDFISERFREDIGATRVWDQFVRTMHGRAVTDPVWDFQSTPAAAEIARGYWIGRGVVASLMLSGTYLIQAIEVLGAPMASSGVRASARAAWNTLPGTRRRKAYVEHLARIGALDDQFANMSWDPSSPIESAARIFSNSVLWLTRLAWIQGSVQAVAAHDMLVKRIEAGKASKAEKIRLINHLQLWTNATQNEAWAAVENASYNGKDPAKLVSRDAARKRLEDVVRAAGAQVINDPQHSAELSRLEHERVVRAGVMFTRFAMMNVRWWGKTVPAAMRSWNRYVDAQKELKAAHEEAAAIGFYAVKGRIDAARTARDRAFQEGASHLKSMARRMAFKSASGVIGMFAQAFLTGGPTGASMLWRRYREDGHTGILKMAWAGFVWQEVAGPFAGLANDIGRRGWGAALEPSLEAISTPWSVGKEVGSAVLGEGIYGQMSPVSRMAKVGERFFGFSRHAATMLAALGIGEDAHRFGVIDREFNACMRDYSGRMVYTEDRSGLLPDINAAREANKKFRYQMRQINQAIKAGDGSVMSRIDEALGIPGKNSENVVDSLRARKYSSRIATTGAGERLTPIIQRRMGKDAWQMMMAHDALIDRIIESVKGY